jgi:hypothetical protein
MNPEKVGAIESVSRRIPITGGLGNNQKGSELRSEPKLARVRQPVSIEVRAVFA